MDNHCLVVTADVVVECSLVLHLLVLNLLDTVMVFVAESMGFLDSFMGLVEAKRYNISVLVRVLHKIARPHTRLQRTSVTCTCSKFVGSS